jgi:hypothetical protein
MKKPDKKQIAQAVVILLCVAVAGMKIDEFGASEFRGARITGPVYSMFDKGWYMFLFAILVTFVYRLSPCYRGHIALFAALSLCYGPRPISLRFSG